MTKKCAVHEVETERLYYSRKLVFNELMYIYQQEQEKTKVEVSVIYSIR
jgi:hypothetical protein